MAGSIMSSRFEAPITMTFSSPSTPSISLSNCGTMVFSTSLETPEPRVPEQRIHLVEEYDHRHAAAGLLTGPLEHQSDVALGFADILVQQLRALDVEEEAATLGGAGALGHLARQ